MDLLQTLARRIRVSTTILVLCAVPLTARAERRAGVDGFGWLGNAELTASLRLLEMESGDLTAQKIEDGAFLLANRLRQSGYLDARISATVEAEGGEERTVVWPDPYEPQLDADLVAESVKYHIDAGLLYYYEDVTISGELPISPDEARAYFIPDTTLYSRKKDKSYSPSIFANQQKQLVAGLNVLGYNDARVTSSDAELDRETGAVNASLTVDAGPIYRVVQLQASIYENGELKDERERPVDHVYNRAWIEEQSRQLRNEAYHLGFPDTKVNGRIASSERVGDLVNVTVLIEVRRGRKFFIGDIEHKGATDTRDAVLARKTRLETGKPLDLTETEAARRRLSRIGIFRRVDLSYEQTSDHVRDVIFNYENGQRVEWQLLAGYGSYEQFRFGVIGKRSNLFGRAHSLSFEAIQSLKSTSGKVSYAVPEIFGEAIDGKFETTFLNRQELYFDRKERGVSIGLASRIERYKLDLGVDYAFERKQSTDPQIDLDPDRLEDDKNIGSITFRASRSTIDNVLYPTSGYELYSATRIAARALGGNTEFIRPEAGASYHRKLGSRWLMHLNARGGYLAALEEGQSLPPAERFLMGGENSLRGFQRGGATPLGAEAFGLVNAELEYPLFDRLSAVVFTDAARVWETSEQFDDYGDYLDVGLGLRYRTIVGPVRLEYARNIDPREGDPKGTLHLSIGFPF